MCKQVLRVHRASGEALWRQRAEALGCGRRRRTRQHARCARAGVSRGGCCRAEGAVPRRAAVSQRCERLCHLSHLHCSSPLRLLLLGLDLAQQQLPLLLPVLSSRGARCRRLPPRLVGSAGRLNSC